ncbi:TPA: LOW QUALITY PROTEIN: hypothetical protein N0F65_012201 [Lagenidium giganteum]|uniref:Uncharacterized protein n=1 Tax=Lagenidium giganteum TaxID=4803 RepID=A0AAV2ZB22_9STRA|nr:TPA: LOW QUALITY PROTEIN: hypothetical protein N0F65_012201 [Lagenidium giganteum]
MSQSLPFFLVDVVFPSADSAIDIAPTTRGTMRHKLAKFRALEFACAGVAFGVAMLFSLTSVHKRVIPSVEVRVAPNRTIWALDPTINEKKLKEQVPMLSLVLFGVGIPIGVNLLFNYGLPHFRAARTVRHDTRDFLLSLLMSIGLSQMLTQFMKNMTGRLRPCFYDMCGWRRDVVWDGVSDLCTLPKWEKEGRKSFPSGHASFAWAALFLLTLYLLGRSKLAAENRSECAYRGGRKTFKLFACFAPTLLAAWVAITRSVDNWHHDSDILAGSLIGALSAALGYWYNYSSIFDRRSAGLPHEACCDQRRDMRHEDEEPLCSRSTSNPMAVHNESLEDDTNPGRTSMLLAKYRALEFAGAIGVLAAAMAFSLTKVHSRAIPNIEIVLKDQRYYALDPNINQKKMKEQGDFVSLQGEHASWLTWFGCDSSVPMIMLFLLGTVIPTITNLTVNYILPRFNRAQLVPHDTRDFFLSLIKSISIAQLLTQFMKNMTGRFRPCFYDMCGWQRDIVWDGVTNLCMLPKWEKEARKSFPSGHASFSWSTLFLLTLYLMGRSKLAAANRCDCIFRGGRKTFKLFLCFVPTLLAAWVAITRSVDNWHHYSDILAGSIIGAFSAALSYWYNYGSIFDWESAGMPLETFHERPRSSSGEEEHEEDIGESELSSLLKMTATSTPHDDTACGAPGPRQGNKWKHMLAEYRMVEFAGTIIVLGVAGLLSMTHVHQREIPNIEVRISTNETFWALDPTINQKRLKEQVPMMALVLFGTGIPILANLIVNYVLPRYKKARVVPHDTRDFLLSLLKSVSLAQLLTQFIKNMTGRFRPCFYDMCGWQRDVVWDGVTNLCTVPKWEKEARKSFPSGHSSFAWSTLFFLTLYLLGRSKLAAENRSECIYRGGRKTFKLFICFAPTLVAAWVAITRSIDNWHHYSDILAGSIIGAFAAGLGYCYNYGSIFHWESAGIPFEEFHTQRRRKRHDSEGDMESACDSGARSNVGPTEVEASSSTNYVAEELLSMRRWLPFEKAILSEMMEEDALLIMGKGLGIQRMFTYFARLYCSRRNLVLCLNANDYVVMFHHLMLSLGGLDKKLLPRVIDTKSTIAERLQLYKRGGCFFITSRILVVDMLNGRIDSKMITGFLVYDAHRVTEISIEAFIVRMYREVNRQGFIKGFSDDAVSLSAGFNKMEQVLKHLYMRKAHLYPRFQMDVNQCLAEHQPQVYEIEVGYSPQMTTIQEALLVALEATMKELQRSTKALDATELTIEKAMTKSFSNMIRRQLDPLWHKLPMKTKQLVGDLTTLRQLLSYLPRYDAISYYSFLLSHETMNGQQRFPSPWLFTEAADRLLRAAKDRLYQLVDTKTRKPINIRRQAVTKGAPSREAVELEFTLEANPKWDALVQILDEVNQEMAETERVVLGGSNVLVMVKDERTCAQLRECLTLGVGGMMKRRFCHYLLQKEAAIKKKGGSITSLGLEQQLLMDAAKKRANQLQLDRKQPAAKGKAKKRDRDATNSNPNVVYGKDVASFGMSMEELEALITAEEKLVQNKRRFQEGTKATAAQTKAMKLSLAVIEPKNEVVICTYAQALSEGYGALSLLQDLMPSVVVLYDPDMAFIRELEVFHATQTTPLEIYFMQYEESAEQQTYLSEIAKEKRAFDALIHQKAHLMMPANVYDLPIQLRMQRKQQPEYSMDTRSGGRARAQRAGVKVVVDVREFRSALPSMLHRDGMLVLPVTLEVGDYVLSPSICVERKSVSDLFGSLNSGRLYNQAESMGRHYELPVLLIEFAQGKAFSLQDPSEIGSEIVASNITSKLSLLVLHFPSLRIVWSRSPHATVEIFKSIKKNQDEPDMETAAAVGTGANTGATSNGTSTSENGLSYNTSAVDVLKRLPGINEHNFRKVLAQVTNLAELSRLSLDELSAIIGKVCAKKLHAFSHTSL